MNNLSREQIVQLAEYMVKKEIKDIVLILKKEYTVTSFLGTIESWSKASEFPFIYEDSKSSHKYVISHEMGKNWSLYLQQLFK